MKIYFAFVALFVYVLYSRRTVREAFQLQQSVSTAFEEENFGGGQPPHVGHPHSTRVEPAPRGIGGRPAA